MQDSTSDKQTSSFFSSLWSKILHITGATSAKEGEKPRPRKWFTNYYKHYWDHCEP